MANNGYVRDVRGGGRKIQVPQPVYLWFSLYTFSLMRVPQLSQAEVREYYLKLENKHLGRVVPCGKLVRPLQARIRPSVVQKSPSGALYHLTLIFIPQLLRLRTFLFIKNHILAWHHREIHSNIWANILTASGSISTIRQAYIS